MKKVFWLVAGIGVTVVSSEPSFARCRHVRYYRCVRPVVYQNCLATCASVEHLPLDSDVTHHHMSDDEYAMWDDLIRKHLVSSKDYEVAWLHASPADRKRLHDALISIFEEHHKQP